MKVSLGVDTSQRADIEVIARTFATNNTGTAATFHPFLKAMRTRGSGILVGMGSVNGIRGFPGHGANYPSKAAMISYCECLRAETGCLTGFLPAVPENHAARTPELRPG